MDVQNIDRVPAFTTKDGSEIRELLAHRNSAIRNQSLAEARLQPGGATTPHYHPRCEEIYYILTGEGGNADRSGHPAVGPGDAIAIPPGQIHQIRNTGAVELKFLCCCAPGYEDGDTVLVEGWYRRWRTSGCDQRFASSSVRQSAGRRSTTPSPRGRGRC